MRILWHANAPWANTGYGQQTKLFVPLLQQLGHDVAVSAFWGLHGAVLNWNGVQVYPGGTHGYGMDVLHDHAKHWFRGDRGLVITLVDTWVLDGPSMSRLPTACWTPIDHEPVPPRVAEFMRSSGAAPIAYSAFGLEQLVKAGFPDTHYVPHGVDTKAYAPGDRDGARKRIGLPSSAHVTTMVAANKGFPPRKSWGQAFQAWARFKDATPDAILYAHTERSNKFHGVDLGSLASACGIPEDSLYFCDQYQNHCGMFGVDYMRDVYAGSDVLLNPAMGEGFGVPIMEAQACGTPVIASGSTAMTELVGAGLLVAGEPWWTEQDAWQIMPSIDEIEMALHTSLTWGSRARELARQKALEYDAERITSHYWEPVLDDLEQTLLGDLIDPAEAVAV